MPVLVQNPCCRHQDLEGTTVVARLIELQGFQASNDKSTTWANNLTQLWIDSRTPFILKLKKDMYETCDRHDYIAVSYSWKHTPLLECSVNGGYRINDAQGRHKRQNRVRDEALERVICYAKYHKVSRIWIDEECIAQDVPMELQIAMNSMDLVYRQSKYPVGLLAVILETQDEVNLLQKLMMGHFIVYSDEDDHPALAHPASGRLSQAIFSMLSRIYGDRWWTRAWIFQEEYLSSTAMNILIRRKPGIAAKREFGYLPNEICLNLSDFRQQVTLFLLAFKRETHHKLSEKCAKMLKRFGKYNVQYHFQHDARRKAMSPRIFADIMRRSVGEPFDRLPIAANSCDYARRLVLQEVSKSSYSVELCLLAMYLLNGEILRDSFNIKKLPTEMSLSNYLQYISFNKFDPPVEQKHLSYLKGCRLHNVVLREGGLLTSGHLWIIEDVLHTSAWPKPPRRSRKCHPYGLNDYQRDCLQQLICHLRSFSPCWESLVVEIDRYLRRDAAETKLSPAKMHMDLMAESVVEAIRTGMPLQLASARESGTACGVFVGLCDVTLGVYTSWHAGIDVDDRYRKSHVSLAVQVEKIESEPLLRTVQWVNGLVFFKKCEEIAVMFEWPQAWRSRR